jgi:hypothetical protein
MPRRQRHFAWACWSAILRWIRDGGEPMVKLHYTQNGREGHDDLGKANTAHSSVRCSLSFDCARCLHIRAQRVAGYGFLFATPWAWLIERLWVPHFHKGWIETILGYVGILWVPATLYSVCLWLLLRVFRIPANRGSDIAVNKI